MNGKSDKIIKFLKILLLALLVIGGIALAIYPVKNQTLTILIDTSIGNKTATYTAEQLSRVNELEISLEGADNTEIKEIRIYRSFKSVCIFKFTVGDLPSYVETQSDKVIFNEAACNILRKQSKSFFLERIFLLECFWAFFLFFKILVNAYSEKKEPNNYNNHGPIKEISRFIGDMRKYGQYMIYAAKADLKAEVANSYLNRLWWLLEPLFNMLVYVIVFGRIMGNSVENYATFIFSALLMWNFFSKTINYSVKCVRNNRDIVTKVYVPKHVLLISNMFLNLFKLVFSLIVLVPMMVIFRVHIGINALWVIPAFLLMILFSFGIGMFFLHYGVYIDDLGYAVGIILQMLMFLSGVFYDVITGLSYPLNVMMLSMNPVSMFIDTMRNALLYNIMSNIPLNILWIVLSLLISYIGIHLVYKNENGYVKVV